CQGARSAPETREAAPEPPSYPGHSLMQDSFLLCKFNNFGDAPALAEIYVEAVLDGFSGLAFAKVYSAKNALTAADLITTRVAPFFSRHGVPIERVITPKTHQYCGIVPTHPYEMFLAASRVNHGQVDEFDEKSHSLMTRFLALLRREFLSPELRRRYRHTLELLQQDLDRFVDTYNSEHPSLAPGMHGQPALQAFVGASRA
ncbi:MAG: hypothetical protein ACRD4Y_06200, partial [Candidatus Acidiferrales bacterium]